MKPRILFYDIETLPLGVDTFRLGKQVVHHNSLQRSRDVYEIICIQYMWEDDDPHVLGWIGDDNSPKGMIQTFDELVREADVLIGKNSDRFDAKHINTLRMINNLPPVDDWSLPAGRDDLEKQIRKHFYLPSYSLDYLCKMLFESGKNDMKFDDWRSIRNYKEALHFKEEGLDRKPLNAICDYYFGSKYLNVVREGKHALRKMYDYGAKDVIDTAKAWQKVLPYIKPRLNLSRFYGHETGNYLVCKYCGHDDLVKNGIDKRLSVPKQRLRCMRCKRESRATILASGELGKID